MKHKIIKSLIIFTLILSTFQFSYASTQTYERPSDNLGITKDIEITSSRKLLIEQTPYVDADEKVYDFADLFTDDEESKLYKSIKNYISETNMDMVIVTIDENNKSSSMAYADDFYDYNDFGVGNNYDGILFLIDMDEKEMWISTTGKAISLYESEIDYILDNCYEYISNEEYYNCADTFITDSLDEYVSSKYAGWFFGFLFAIIASVLVPTIFCLVQKAKHKAIKLATNADSYLDKGSVIITDSKDTFVRTHTSRVAKSSSSSGGGGSHSGSSGISHGGGGRSF